MDHYELGYKVIQWIQAWHNPDFDYFFSAVSVLGLGHFYVFAIPAVYWCLNKQFGARLAFLFLFGIFLNTWVKYYFQTGRPSPERVRVVFPRSGGGHSFPSGHAQGVVSFWVYCMVHVRKAWFSWFCMAFIVVMCVSRLYLGLHFPWDVMGGAAIGLASLIFFFFLLSAYEKIKPRLPWSVWLLAVVVICLVLVWFFPQKRYGFMTGSFLGFCGGALLEERFVKIQVRQKWQLQLKKLALGWGTGLVIVWAGLLELQGWSGVSLVSYGVAGVWASLGAPWCFKKLGWG